MTIRTHNLQKETKVYKTYNLIHNDKKERTRRTSLHCNTSLHFTTLHPSTLHYTYRHFTPSLHYPLICLNPFTFPTALITFPTALNHISYRSNHISYRSNHISYRSNHISYRSNHISYRSNTSLN
jgi:hypothetical protein